MRPVSENAGKLEPAEHNLIITDKAAARGSLKPGSGLQISAFLALPEKGPHLRTTND